MRLPPSQGTWVSFTIPAQTGKTDGNLDYWPHCNHKGWLTHLELKRQMRTRSQTGQCQETRIMTVVLILESEKYKWRTMGILKCSHKNTTLNLSTSSQYSLLRKKARLNLEERRDSQSVFQTLQQNIPIVKPRTAYENPVYQKYSTRRIKTFWGKQCRTKGSLVCCSESTCTGSFKTFSCEFSWLTHTTPGF